MVDRVDDLIFRQHRCNVPLIAKVFSPCIGNSQYLLLFPVQAICHQLPQRTDISSMVIFYQLLSKSDCFSSNVFQNTGTE
jgi:hypothetical protein